MRVIKGRDSFDATKYLVRALYLLVKDQNSSSAMNLATALADWIKEHD